MRLLLLCIFVCVFALQGCTCCAYFNHMWNAEEAYDSAAKLRKERLDTTPDSILVMGTEQGLYNRVIEKSSRTVERFPKNKSQVPKAVFFMAESFRHKSEWKKAIEKYDELERYFPKYDSMPNAEYQRAWCLYKTQDFALSRFAVDRILAKGEEHPFRLPALELLSYLQEIESLPEDAIASLEAVLATSFGSVWTRAKARLRLADLYYEQKSYAKAREHYMHSDILILHAAERYRAMSSGAECLFFLGEKDRAAKEYIELADSTEFENFRFNSLVRHGEILLDLGNPYGKRILQVVTISVPKSENAARAFFSIGDFEQSSKDYPSAILYYDSSFQSLPSSKWGKESYIRKSALARLLVLKDTIEVRKEAQKDFFPQEFQIAELFLFKLSETDSALSILTRMDSALVDSALRIKALYARAYIYDDIKKDTASAYAIYRDIIQRSPGSDYARQAQANMGQRITSKSEEELAEDALVRAEKAWLKAQAIPVEEIDEVERAYKEAITLYDSVSILFPNTNNSLKAMFAKAHILGDEIGEKEEARVIFAKISREHSRTPLGRASYDKIAGKYAYTETDIIRLRNRVENVVKETEQSSAKYWRDTENTKIEMEKPPVIIEDEVLKNDYNTLYDFK